MPMFQRSPRSAWERPLSWTHLVAFLAFVLVNQSMAVVNERLQARRLAQPVAQAAPLAGSSLHQRLLAQARHAGFPLRWTAHDPQAERPAGSVGQARRGRLIATVRQAIADERLNASAQHRPLPEVEACLDNGVLVIRDVDLSRSCPPEITGS